MMETGTNRGTAVLVITIIVVSAFVIAVSLPRENLDLRLTSRVAIIDSGITKDSFLSARIVAEKSFVNTSLGYHLVDNSTEDSNPNGSPHGTYVARIIASQNPTAAIINAKVVSEGNSATLGGIVSAIHWAVAEANCSVINLSLGTAPIGMGILRETIQWAFERGVSIVAAVGNNGHSGVAGSSIESPALYPEVIGVAAVDDLGAPYSFSGRGPLRNRTIKPDISALGRYSSNGRTLFGTSFATPRVSAAATQIIDYCTSQGWSWTPGMVKAAIMASADYLACESWEIGSGLLNTDKAIEYISNVQNPNGLPLVGAVLPDTGPYTFERWFANTTVSIMVSVFCSTNANFSISYGGAEFEWMQGPEQVQINQSGFFTFDVVIPPDITKANAVCTVTMVSQGYRYLRSRLSFSVSPALAKVALDVSHTPWRIDSIYGQFREMYEVLTLAGIAVEEIPQGCQLTIELLSHYDAVFILDPCAWGTTLDGWSVVLDSKYNYTDAEKAAIWEYWLSGGSILVAGVTNISINIEEANELLSMFDIWLNYDQIPTTTITVNGISSTALVSDMHDHPTTRGIANFDFNGCSINYTGDVYELAWTELNYQVGSDIQTGNRTLMVALEGDSSARLVAFGTNFLLDNWGLSGLYRSDDNSRFLLQLTYWLIGII
ncbi:MAG: S8 family serine peptidase [Promethearchaeota archaeon]